MKHNEPMEDVQLVERFKTNPEQAYRDLLEQYTPAMLRMIRRFIKDPDEVMEIYTAVCERLCAEQYQALRRYRGEEELSPWLSVVIANACRDRFRKRRALSVPKSVLKQLDDRERLVFKYYYQENLAHEDIAEIISLRHRVAYTALEVVRAIGKINNLLSDRKRWLLLAALRANKPLRSLDELKEVGIEVSGHEDQPDDIADLWYRQEQLERLRKALSQLDVEDQLLIQLRYEQNRAALQIADIMGYDSYKYVYTRLNTVERRLRKLMGLDDRDDT